MPKHEIQKEIQAMPLVREPGMPKREFSRRSLFIGLAAAGLASTLESCSANKQPTATANTSTATPTEALPTKEPYSFTPEQQQVIDMLDKMSPEEFAKQPIKDRALWSTSKTAQLAVSGYPVAFNEILVPGGIGVNANPKTLVNGNPWDFPLGEKADPQDIGIQRYHNDALIYDYPTDIHNPNAQPFNLPIAKKFLSTFYTNPASPVYKQILDEIKHRKETAGVDGDPFRGRTVLSVVDGEYKAPDEKSYPSKTILYKPSNSNSYNEQFMFLDMSDVLGEAPYGGPAGMWLSTGNIILS